MTEDTSRVPFSGSQNALVIAIDFGTTYSGISYAFLNPGEVPVVRSVTDFRGQEHQAGTKVPSVIYYDQIGVCKAAGAETYDPEITEKAENEEWIRLSWFKLHLRPAGDNTELAKAPCPALPSGKTIEMVLGDFLKYMNTCAKTYITATHNGGDKIMQELIDRPAYVLSHPNGWDGFQQAKMQTAAILGGLIPDTDEGRSRVTFVSEGEASFYWYIDSGLASRGIKLGNHIIIADAGGGTIDVSAFEVTEERPLCLKETRPPECRLAGSIFVTKAFEGYARELLKGSDYGVDGVIECLKEEFDKKTKCLFRSDTTSTSVQFGTPKDNLPEFGIKSGRLQLRRDQVVAFFEHSCQAAVDAIHAQLIGKGETLVYLVGGFAASQYLMTELEQRLKNDTVVIKRGESHTAKAVSDGAVCYFLSHPTQVRYPLSPPHLQVHGAERPQQADTKQQNNMQHLAKSTLRAPGIGDPPIHSLPAQPVPTSPTTGDNRSVAFSGNQDALVIAIDVGTTYSGVSYAFLNPGEVPVVRSVNRFPGQEHQAGSTKVPTVMYYDRFGVCKAAGAETNGPEIMEEAEYEDWMRLSWFKLHLWPTDDNTELAKAPHPALPHGKTIEMVLGDFLKYMDTCAKNHITTTHVMGERILNEVVDRTTYVLSHPNGWGGLQQAKMQTAAVLGGLIPDTSEGRSRVMFVSEGEANFRWCVDSGLASNQMNLGNNIITVDAGGGMISVSAFEVTKEHPLCLKETRRPECRLAGSIFVTKAFEDYARVLLKDSVYGDDDVIQTLKEEFDQKTKRLFRSDTQATWVSFGSRRDNSPEVGIRSGRLQLMREQVILFFERSCQAAEDAIRTQLVSKDKTSVYMVGGFSGSQYLMAELERRLSDCNVEIKRAESNAAKAVSEASVGYFLDRVVLRRVAGFTHGTVESFDLQSTNYDQDATVTSVSTLVPLNNNLTGSVSLEDSSPIGYGGFGDLFLGVHHDHGKVALKKPRKILDESLVRRFLREVDLWCSVSHKYVLPCLGMCTIGSHVYVVSPFIKNGDLASCMARGMVLNRSNLLFEVAEALTHLHHQGIVHGDVKAQNILLADDGSPLLCDFGLAKAFDTMATSTEVKGAGSVRWMAPELFRDESRSMASDVYSFGITISEVLSGCAPYLSISSNLAVMRYVDDGGRPPKEPLRSSEGRSYSILWETAEKCWAKEPGERPHMAQVLGMLFPLTREKA